MQNYICIKCPVGCRLIVDNIDEEITVIGNKCTRGAEFGRQEFTNPKRTVTSLIKVINGDKPVLPVKTTKPVYKENIRSVLDKIAKISVPAPIKIGDIICKDIEEGVDLVATSITQRI